MMDLRGISVTEMAKGSGLSMATIMGLRSGYMNPHRSVLSHIPEVLRIPAEDLVAIAGLDPEDGR
ncbi:helix-turn-helix domain-containing protein [Micromonospora cathayae]|uniref:Helix-turn-helix transcriptional regulator n=1 Tax=Micromonospora cathayae TaxID=3028804 RepID=A0ABY7ZZT6_9ACTN|nr:helix-turn-helix transcriptional regulator [Micromonospora sp. HUAS 3]WDZ87264.1 helix-turn-helix transcriptional regulator [Micromonospora sp. HUAS 3]